MAVDSSAFYVNQTEIDAKIDTLILGLQTNITDIITHLEEDVTTHYVTVISSEHSQFQKKLKNIEKDFRWYRDLANTGEVYRLMGAIADDSAYDVKECFVLDRVFIAN